MKFLTTILSNAIIIYFKYSILLLISLCVCIKCTGQNFGNSNPVEHRERILNSFLYKGIDMFYLRDTTVSNEKYKELCVESKKELEALTNEIFFSLKKEYKRKRRNLKAYLEQGFPKNLKIKLFLRDTIKGAKTQSFKNQDLFLFIHRQ